MYTHSHPHNATLSDKSPFATIDATPQRGQLPPKLLTSNGVATENLVDHCTTIYDLIITVWFESLQVGPHSHAISCPAGHIEKVSGMHMAHQLPIRA